MQYARDLHTTAQLRLPACCCQHLCDSEFPTMQTFDELLLLKRGGSVIYNGRLGRQSVDMISYFSAIDGVKPIEDGYSTSLHHNQGGHIWECCCQLFSCFSAIEGVKPFEDGYSAFP